MAEKLTPAEQKELNSLLKEKERVEKQISVNVEKAANARHMEKKRLEELIKKGDEESAQLSAKIQKLQKQKDTYDDIVDITKKLKVTDKDALDTLTNRVKGNNLMASVLADVIAAREEENNLEGDALKQAQERRGVMTSLAVEVIGLAEKVNGHKSKEKTFDEERNALIEKLKGAKDEVIQRELKLLEIKHQLIKIDKRQHALQHAIHEAAHGLPESLVGAAKGAMGLFKAVASAGLAMGPLILMVAVLGAALHVFMDLDKQAQSFRENTGFTARMTEKIDHDVHHIAMGYRQFGLDAEKAYKVLEEMANAQSDMFHFSEATQVSMGLLNTQMGIAVKDATKVSSMFEQVGKLSESAAAGATLDAAKMFADVGVSAKEGFEDMAASAGVLSKHMKGNVQLFVQQAVKAKMLGTTLKDLTETAEHLLNFESSIEDELTAATMVGGQFNLSRARALAYEGKIAEANEATLDAIQASGDFRQQDYFTQTQLAKAAGKSVEEITRELGVRDKLQSLSGDALKNAQKAIDAGIDIRDLSEEDLKKKADAIAANEKIAGVTEQINNAIAGIVEKVGGNLTPAFQLLGNVVAGVLNILGAIGSVVSYVTQNTAGLVGFFVTLAALTFLIYKHKLNSLRVTIAEQIAERRKTSASLLGAVASIFSGQGKLPIIGAVIAAAMVGALFAAAGKAMSFGNDIASFGSKAGYGKRTLFGPEGAIQLNDKDTVLAGTKMFDNKSDTVASRKITDSPIAAANNNMIGALIQEFRGVRADMASGKIGVYMDGSKVTANVTNTMDNSTRNKFALA